jgi:hypothetical protein
MNEQYSCVYSMKLIGVFPLNNMESHKQTHSYEANLLVILVPISQTLLCVAPISDLSNISNTAYHEQGYTQHKIQMLIWPTSFILGS